MSIELQERVTDDDYFNLDVQTYVNPVNCLGIMGAGLAKQFKYRFPVMFETYRRDCMNGLYMPGTVTLWMDEYLPKRVLNFTTKGTFHDPSDLKYVEAGLKDFVSKYKELGITSIVFPRLGCGLGRLSWHDVKPLMFKYLDPLTVDIRIVIMD